MARAFPEPTGVWRGVPLRSPAAAEARLRLLMRAVDDIFDRAEATLACTSYRSRCWLSSYWQETFCNRPLRILPRRTREKYKSRWKHFTCYLFRAFALKPRQRREIYNVPLRGGGGGEEAEEEEAYGDWSHQGEGSEGEEEDEEEDRAEADGYDESDGEGDNYDNDGAGEEDDEEGKDEQDYAPGQHTFRISRGTRLKLSEALFQLSMMFWTHQCQAGVMASSALIHFTAVMGIHPRSLAYRSAYSSTPGFAALVWIGRLFFLEYSLPLYSYTTLVQIWPARDIYPSQPERLEAIRTKHMLRGCHSPLGEILELKAFAKSIIKQEGSAGNLTWAQDGRSFTIGNDKVVELSDFCVTHHAAITRVQERVDEMMLGWKLAVDLSAIRDDLTCRLPGWCFLEKPENGLMGFYKAMARRAWSSSFRGQALAKSGHWLPGSCQAYLEAGAELTTMIFAAFHLTAGLPGRGTEATSIRLRNTKLAIRNLFIREGQATKALQSLTRHLRTPWTLSLYRQAALAIAKRYISDLITKRNFYYPSDASTPIRMIAAGVGHHPRTLLTAYAIDTALPARLQPELLEMYRQLSTLWQDWNWRYFRDYCIDRGVAAAEPSAPPSTMPSAGKQKRQGSHSEDVRIQKRRKVQNTDQSRGAYPGADAINGFIFNRQYGILICVPCKSMIQPGRASLYKHLNSQHRITGQISRNDSDTAYLEQVPQLIASEFRQAHSLLYDELLFGCKDISPVEARRVQDDLDSEEYGDSWVRHPRNAEIVLGTGSGKTLIVIVAASLAGAGTTVLILPTMALRGNMVGRLDEVRLRHHVWERESKRVAPVVIISAEAAYIDGFLDYAHRLVDRQQLDRILTATLPPVYFNVFIGHNKLVRPRVVHESTNRANLRYLVQRQGGPGSVAERVLGVVRDCCEREDMFDRAQDRIIVYCLTKSMVDEVARKLGCQSYTGEMVSEEEKGAVINR
ncbi:hypothetical protein MRS44_017265 [Fusarium solani]|uniref:uncharacterized protein n=1 Tax=Fusarium solani TaxID=169388 RepID=UPI0032C46136|nr:hypothetical protein MRS44_017265 [Fusarium solani]